MEADKIRKFIESKISQYDDTFQISLNSYDFTVHVYNIDKSKGKYDVQALLFADLREIKKYMLGVSTYADGPGWDGPSFTTETGKSLMNLWSRDRWGASIYFGFLLREEDLIMRYYPNIIRSPFEYEWNNKYGTMITSLKYIDDVFIQCLESFIDSPDYDAFEEFSNKQRERRVSKNWNKK